jgi:carbonic anhydrase
MTTIIKLKSKSSHCNLFRIVFVTVFFVIQNYVNARTWNDVTSNEHIQFEDTVGNRYIRMMERKYEIEAFTGSDGVYNNNHASSPSFEPTSSTDSPSYEPTDLPITTQPTYPPTPNPTALPTTVFTSIPTSKPTLTPTSIPTSLPTTFVDPFAPAIVPKHPDSFYFNYDNSTFSQYGPGQLGLIEEKGKFHVGIQNNQWGKVNVPSNFYWQEFSNNGWGPWKDSFDNTIFVNNVCNSGQMQSPIDLRTRSGCDASHQIRPLRGDFKLRSNSVTKKIFSNKLRLEYRRRPCADRNDDKCKEPDPPHADFPNGFSGFSDVMHIDIKVPSEHMINGVQYDAEMQIFHYHPARKRFPVQSVLIRAIDDDKTIGVNNTSFNAYFQALVNQFQYVYNINAFRCGIIRNNKRRRRLSSFENRAIFSSRFDNSGRKLQDTITLPSIWDPYHPTLVPTIWFYRYDGSLTEPPCSEVVSWFVADEPMIISPLQLEQLKLILFTNVDIDCQKTSVHNLRSVARPIRQSNSRSVAHCTADNFGPDVV